MEGEQVKAGEDGGKSGFSAGEGSMVMVGSEGQLQATKCTKTLKRTKRLFKGV